MKINKIFLVLAVCFVIPLKGLCQQVYHVDPNTVRATATDNSQTAIDATKLQDKITIFNGYNSDYVVLMSSDMKNWNPVTLPKTSYSIFTLTSIYAKIYSGTNVYFIANLKMGSIYSLVYDFSAKKWTIAAQNK